MKAYQDITAKNWFINISSFNDLFFREYIERGAQWNTSWIW
jgi:hypothetical protein